MLALVERWVELLAADRFDDALALLAPRPDWTVKLLKTVIGNYGFIEPRGDGKTFTVSPIAAAKGDRPRAELVWLDRERNDLLGYVCFALPLNGEWSDVTALFDLLASPSGVVLALDDVHVL